jgi:hypothetical protein
MVGFVGLVILTWMVGWWGGRGRKEGGMLERSIEKALQLRLKKLGYTSLKLNVSAQVGWPDRIIVLPNGKVVWVELKSKGGKVSPIQKHIHGMLRALGHSVIVSSDVEKIIEFEDYRELREIKK